MKQLILYGSKYLERLKILPIPSKEEHVVMLLKPSKMDAAFDGK